MFTGPLRTVGVVLALSVMLLTRHVTDAQDAANMPPDNKQSTDEKAIRALIVQLADDSFDVREAAAKRLAAIGEPALELLQKAVRETKDAEVRARAEQLIAAIEPLLFPMLQTMKGHDGGAMRIAVAPDAKHFITSGRDGARLWETATGMAVLDYGNAKIAYWSLAISADGSLVIAASGDKTVRVFEFRTGKETQQLRGHTGEAWAATLLAGNRRAISGGWDRSLRLWDVATGDELGSFPGVTEKIRCLALSPDGRTIAVGHFGDGSAPTGTLRLWDVAAQKEIKEFRGHKREVSSVSFSIDGKRLLTSSFDQTVRVWDVATGNELKRFTGTSRFECAAFVEGGRRVLCTGNENDPTIQLWDVDSGMRLLRSASVPGGFLAVAALPGDRRAVTAGRDGMIRIWQWKK